MIRRSIAIVTLAALAWPGAAAAAERLSQRVWLTQGVPGEPTLAALRAGGIDGAVLPVGDVVVADGTCRLTLAPLPDLKGLADWKTTPLVWVSGQGGDSGDARRFLDELAPVERLLQRGGSMVLAARAGWPGLVPFAESVSKRRGTPVEVLLPARSVPGLARAGVPESIRFVAVALGNPPAMGFPVSTPADDLAALDEIDETGVRYRVALVVAPRATPSPGVGGASLGPLATPNVAEYRPAEWGDVFVLRQPHDWGGTLLAPRETIQVEAVDTARYHHDLGSVLRAVRPRLEGWDVAGLPAREPTLGLSLEAFLDYLQGGQPFPAPHVQPEWVSPARLRIAVANPTPHSSAVASTGNYVELRFEGTQMLDVVLGDFSGTDYGRIENGIWRRAVARDANAVRLYLTYLPPSARLAGATVTFFGRPSGMTARWMVRLGNGAELAGDVESLGPFRKP